MQISNLTDFHRGWIIGDFSPSLVKSKEFEVGLLTHLKGERWPKHYHAIATEYNVLVSGRMTINGMEIIQGQVFVIEPGEVADPFFVEDCLVLCIKIPSLPNDKYESI
jgi:quercetin dioxygenase-like cupin family protein